MTKGKIAIGFLFSLLVACVPAARARDGHATGNGGDHVRSTFLKMGDAVIRYLADTREGQELLSKNAVGMDRLRATLEARKIAVVEGTLLDNGGVPVDATGIRDKITLAKDRWSEHFEKERDVYYLVFHEMLRSLAVVDDDYVISKALRPFPISRRVVTRMTAAYPLAEFDRISDWLKTDAMALSGSGCPLGQLGTAADFDSERNQLDLAFLRYELRTDDSRRQALASCQLALPIAVPAGRRLVISQLDMTAKFELAPGSMLTIENEAFLAGDRAGLSRQSHRAGPGGKKGRLLDRRNEVLRTGCGADSILRLNTKGILEGEGAAVAHVDRITLSFKVESCQ